MQQHMITVLTAAVVTLGGASPSGLVGRPPAVEAPPGFALVPAGSFEMGDHHGFVDPAHGSDETPLHKVRLDAFYMGVFDVTTEQFCEFLNAALAARTIEMRQGGVYLAGKNDLLAETRVMSPYSRVGWDGSRFTVLDGKERHPVVCVRWPGAAVYANWLSVHTGRPQAYDTTTWQCRFNVSGFRLPTEAEWEYAARGGLKDPYRNFPWGDDADATKANWPESKNPFRAGPLPWTTPVGFFDGSLRRKSDMGWPGAQPTFQTSNGANGYGLHDMAGNVWQFVNDWYERGYYAYSPAENPTGPASGSPMPDGKPYRVMRGGNWYNGENGHGRVSNRDPSYFRGPDDPNHPYYHVGFRVVLPVNAESRPVVQPTPVPSAARGDAGRGDRPPDGANRPPRPGAARGGGQPPNASRPAPRGAELQPAVRTGSLVLRSPEVKDGGALPAEFTGDGAAATLPLEWSGAPAGTKSFALVMHHIDPEGVVKWYWILYDIPATVQSLPKNVKGIGTLGNNSINRQTGYAPPNSKGPGAKTYILTLYALSAPPQLSVPPERVNREVLLDAIKDRILGSAELRVVYTRSGEGGRGGDEPPPQGGGRGRGGQPAQASLQIEGGQPPRGGQGGRGGQPPRGGQQGGAGQRGPAMAENKTPTSPNPGQTVGLFRNLPGAYAGYTLFAPKHNTVTYLMDNEGRVVHQWKSAYEPGQSAYLKPNGNLLHTCFTKSRAFTGGGEGGRVEEYDWDGRLVWEFEYSSDSYLSHHDIAPMPNGNILLLVVEKKTMEQAVAAGFNPELLRDAQLFPDSVIEVQPTYPKGGRIVWEWKVWDHLVQDFDRTKANFGDVAAHPELVDVHCNGRGAPAFWNHMNSIAYNSTLDQVMLSVRGSNEIWLLDHGTTTKEAAGHAGGRHGKGGDLIYRWGNPAAYKRGAVRDKQLVQQHDAQWIPDGYPGAGHITIFNNGYDRGYSSIEEIVPPVAANGRYIIEGGKAYGPDKPVWHYEAGNRTDFFSSEISGAQRLPNGNTLICAGVVGHLFEITPAGEMVWQYVNPMVRGGILAQGEVPGKDVRGHLFNAIFKVHRYQPDYLGLRGRDLTPKGVIELPASQKGKTGLDKADAPPDERRGGRGRGGQAPSQRPSQEG
jgi:formylglycine-generating enzyme required for sulfatase activity/phosphatidylethanolamine-binding protein (PEBP) family uncharacterized protein